MNLNAIASSFVSAVNPTASATVLVSDGYTTQADGKQVPKYLPARVIAADVQNMTYRDLAQDEGLNLNGVKKAIYLNGRLDGVIRAEGKGGDLITIRGGGWDGTEWIVAQVLEYWNGWTKVAATLQRAAPIAAASNP